MQALTAIGEVGIEVEGRSYLLRPSLFSMTRIGSPAEILETFALLCGGEPPRVFPDCPVLDAAAKWRRDRFSAALIVMNSCTEDDLGELIGGFSGPRRYTPGRMPMADIIQVARSLILHGVTGNAKPDPRKPVKPGDYLTEFRAKDYVACAMAHLGASERDAWAMTMTSFTAAMRSKYPPPEDKPDYKAPPTPEVIDATMERLRKINALREGKK